MSLIKNKKKLKFLRDKIDKIDLKLLALIKIRTQLVNKVIKVKKFKKQIIDQNRIKKVLKNIRKLSVKKKIDPIITKRIWSNMIKAYIDYESKNFKEK